MFIMFTAVPDPDAWVMEVLQTTKRPRAGEAAGVQPSWCSAGLRQCQPVTARGNKQGDSSALTGRRQVSGGGPKAVSHFHMYDSNAACVTLRKFLTASWHSRTKLA